MSTSRAAPRRVVPAGLQRVAPGVQAGARAAWEAGRSPITPAWEELPGYRRLLECRAFAAGLAAMAERPADP